MAPSTNRHESTPELQRPLKTTDSSGCCCCLSVNSLPSIWFGIGAVSLQVYIILQSGKTFFEYMDSKFSTGISTWERNLYVALQGAALLLLPILAFASVFKLGNLANDGFRLGRRLDLEMDLDLPRSRNRDPLITSGSACGAAWRHCPPLGPTLHVIIALCSLMAKVVLEARFIKDGISPRDHIWNTDLDLVFLHSLWPEKVLTATQLVREVPYPSPEFLGYVLALLAFAVRCSDVYWGVNKCLSFLISLQLTANSLSALLAFCGASILYKVELIGVPTSLSSGVKGSLSDYMLLDPPITVMLVMLLSLTLLLASSPLSMYALNKLSAFLMKSRKRYMQELPAARSYLWSFYPHLAALATLLAIAACCAPILHDLSRLYKFNPQPVLLASVTGSIVHAFLWVALWLLLTAKTNWDFRLKISVGRTLLRSPSCLALAAQVEFRPDQSANKKKQKTSFSDEAESLLNGASNPPILVLAGGKAYNVSDNRVQRQIHQLIDDQEQGRVAGSGSKERVSRDQHQQAYWLRGEGGMPSPSDTETLSSPTLPEPHSGGSSSSGSNHHHHGGQSHIGVDVTVDRHNYHNTSGEMVGQTSVQINNCSTVNSGENNSVVLSPILIRPVRKPLMRIPGGGAQRMNSEAEDGDYATLRDLPLVTLPEEPIDTTHETSSSSDGADSGFGSGTKHSPRVLARDLCNPYGYVKPKMITFAALPGQNHTIALHPTAPSPRLSQRVAPPFHSLPPASNSNKLIGNMKGASPSHRPMTETSSERRPVIQACLFAGQGLESTNHRA